MLVMYRSLGVTLYQFIFGQLPFTARTLHQIYQHIIEDPLTFPDNIPIPDELKHLLSRLLDKDPTTRITIPEIKRHPWVTNNGEWKPPNYIYT